MSFFRELRRRNVFKVGAAYVVVAWLLIQVSDAVLPTFSTPEWVGRTVIFLLILGFPVAVLLAWAYEVTPEGIKRTKQVRLANGIPDVARGKLGYALAAILMLIIGLMLVDRYFLGLSGLVETGAERHTDANAPAGTGLGDGLSRDRRSIAVLPFANRSARAEDEFFVGGIHDDLLTQLAKISALKVISRTSVMEYRNRTENLREIGQELGVATILEGAVQRAGETVRINVQLIDAATDEHLWAESYDRALTAQNIFAIQTEMAESIARALEATLSPQEVARLSATPTNSIRAYNFYLSGNEYIRGTDNTTAFALAAQQYERAVEEDPDFALAWAALAQAYSGMYLFRADPTESRRELARNAVERAFQLAPNLPEAHLARGYYYYHGFLNYERALEELDVAEAGMPGDSRIFQARAYIYRRLGEFERSITSMEPFIARDPRNVEHLLIQVLNFENLRDYDEADLYVERAREIAPDNADAIASEAYLPLFEQGEVTQLRLLAETPPVDLGLFRHRAGWIAAIYDRNYDEALRYLDDWQVEVDVGGGLFLGIYVPVAAYYGTTYRLAGQPELASERFDAVRRYVEDVVARDPGDAFAQLALAEALAGSGESESAIELAQRAMTMLPRERDGVLGQILQLEAVMRVLLPAGDYDAAIANLDQYFANPGQWSIAGLMGDPRLDSIRADPRFQALVEKYERP